MSVGEGATLCQDISEVPGNLYDKTKPMKAFTEAPHGSVIDFRPRYIVTNENELPKDTNFTILRANKDGSNNWVHHVKLKTADLNWKGWAIMKASIPGNADHLVVIFPGPAGCVFTPKLDTLNYKTAFSYQIIAPPIPKAHIKRTLGGHKKAFIHGRSQKGAHSWTF